MTDDPGASGQEEHDSEVDSFPPDDDELTDDQPPPDSAIKPDPPASS
jgi:hypothetical protein